MTKFPMLMQEFSLVAGCKNFMTTSMMSLGDDTFRTYFDPKKMKVLIVLSP